MGLFRENAGIGIGGCGPFGGGPGGPGGGGGGREGVGIIGLPGGGPPRANDPGGGGGRADGPKPSGIASLAFRGRSFECAASFDRSTKSTAGVLCVVSREIVERTRSVPSCPSSWSEWLVPDWSESYSLSRRAGPARMNNC
jgi:hypothetical protein